MAGKVGRSDDFIPIGLAIENGTKLGLKVGTVVDLEEGELVGMIES